MQDSIDSDFLRKLCFECEQHLKINLAQPFAACNALRCAFQNSNACTSLWGRGRNCCCSGVNSYYGEPYPSEPVSSPPWHVQWRCTPVFVRTQMFPWWWLVMSLAPACVSSALSRQSQKKSGNSTSIWTSWGLTQPPQKLLFGLWAVQSGRQRANTHIYRFVIYFTIGFNYVQSPLNISKPRLSFLRCELSKRYWTAPKLSGVSR